MEQITLLIFSICVQAAIGIIVFVAIAKLLNKEGTFKLPVVTAAGLAVIGLIASLLHLGRPLRALNSLMYFASSWLSREIWFTALFTGLTVIAALLILFKPDVKNAAKALIPIAAIFGLIDVYMMASVYHFASVPAWQSCTTYVEFYTTMISMGAVLFLVLGRSEATGMTKIAGITVGLAVAIQVVSMMIYYVGLGINPSLAAQQSLTLIANMSMALAINLIFILCGTGLILFSLGGTNKVVSPGNTAALETAVTTETVSAGSTGILALAAAALVIGLIVGRYLFYAMMVISRVGLN